MLKNFRQNSSIISSQIKGIDNSGRITSIIKIYLLHLMILADSEIKQRIESGSLKIETLDHYDIFQQIGPSSLDFRLGNDFKFYQLHHTPVIDPREPLDPKMIQSVHIDEGDYFLLHPRQFVLGVTVEKISVPNDLVARCEGRSSLGRLGIIIHSTAGFIDPGFSGTVTLEITNINTVPIKIYPGMRFGQFAFETIQGTCLHPYNKRLGSKYMHQQLPQESMIHKDLY